MKVAAVLLLGVALASDARAHCFAEDNSPHSELFHGGSSVPSGSGLVAHAGPRGLWNPLGQKGDTVEDPKAWKLTADSATIEVTRKDIAPGLFIVVPATPVTGTVEVTDPSGQTRTITFTADALPALLPAPRVTKLRRRVDKGRRGEKRTLGTATVKGEVPDDAVALVAYVGTKAVAWARASRDENGGIEIFHDARPCWSQPNDAPAPRAGTKVSFAWLDNTGRLSKRSAAIAVK